MSAPDPHPIVLLEVLFTRSVVVAVPGHEVAPGSNKLSPQNTIHVELPEGGEPYRVIMRTIFNPEMDKSAPYSIDMECIATLTANDTLSDDEKRRGVMITGHNVLYGAIREAVAWLTSRQVYGPLMLGLSVLRTDASSQSTPPIAE